MDDNQTHQATLDLARQMLRPFMAERARTFENSVAAILAKAAAAGSLMSGGTLRQLRDRSEVELRERADTLISISERLFKTETLIDVDALAAAFKALFEMNITS